MKGEMNKMNDEIQTLKKSRSSLSSSLWSSASPFKNDGPPQLYGAKMPQLDTALENKKKNVETREKCFKDFSFYDC